MGWYIPKTSYEARLKSKEVMNAANVAVQSSLKSGKQILEVRIEHAWRQTSVINQHSLVSSKVRNYAETTVKKKKQ